MTTPESESDANVYDVNLFPADPRFKLPYLLPAGLLLVEAKLAVVPVALGATPVSPLLLIVAMVDVDAVDVNIGLLT